MSPFWRRPHLYVSVAAAVLFGLGLEMALRRESPGRDPQAGAAALPLSDTDLVGADHLGGGRLHEQGPTLHPVVRLPGQGTAYVLAGIVRPAEPGNATATLMRGGLPVEESTGAERLFSFEVSALQWPDCLVLRAEGSATRVLDLHPEITARKAPWTSIRELGPGKIGVDFDVGLEPGHSLSGRVAWENGAPCNSATCSLSLPGTGSPYPTFDRLPGVTTHENGVFHLSGLPCSGLAEVRVDLPGLADWKEVTFDLAITNNLDLEVEFPRQVLVHARRAAASPECTIRARRADGLGRALPLIDAKLADGQARIWPLHSGETITLSVLVPGYLETIFEKGLRIEQPSTDLVLTLDELSLRPTDHDAVGQWSFQLFFIESDGSPLSVVDLATHGVRVDQLQVQPLMVPEAKTMRLTPEFADPHVPFVQTVTIFGPSPIDLRVTCGATELGELHGVVPAAEHSLVIQAEGTVAPARVRHVLSARNERGAPVALLRAELEQEDGTDHIAGYASDDGSGRITVSLLDRPYRYLVVAESGQRKVGRLEASEGGEHSIVFGQASELRGRVRVPTQARSAFVAATPAAAPLGLESTKKQIGEDGAFVFEALQPGRYGLIVMWIEDPTREELTLSWQTVEVAPGTIEHVDLGSPEGPWASLSIRSPVCESTTIRLSSEAAPLFQGTLPDGFSLRVPAGRYWIEGHCTARGSPRFVAEEHELEAGTTTTVVIDH